PGQREQLLGRRGEAGTAERSVSAGGASPPAGPYEGALALLETIAPARRGLTVGVGAHPEGHPFVDAPAALELLRRKAEHASYVATQMLFAPGPLVQWVAGLRRRGSTSRCGRASQRPRAGPACCASALGSGWAAPCGCSPRRA